MVHKKEIMRQEKSQCFIQHEKDNWLLLALKIKEPQANKCVQPIGARKWPENTRSPRVSTWNEALWHLVKPISDF